MIVMDFDGVMFDTVREAYAIIMLVNDPSLNLQDIKFDTKHYQDFKKLRFSVGPARDYLKILKHLNASPLAKKFDINNIHIDEKYLVEFSNKFYKLRKSIIDNHYSYWIGLNKPYQFFNKLNKINNLKIVILTNKDRYSVLKILNHYNASFKYSVIDKNFLYKYSSKKDVLAYLSKNERLCFIDDNQEYVDQAKELEYVDSYTAGWGYTEKKTIFQLSQKKIINIVQDIVENQIV